MIEVNILKAVASESAPSFENKVALSLSQPVSPEGLLGGFGRDQASNLIDAVRLWLKRNPDYHLELPWKDVELFAEENFGLCTIWVRRNGTERIRYPRAKRETATHLVHVGGHNGVVHDERNRRVQIGYASVDIEADSLKQAREIARVEIARMYEDKLHVSAEIRDLENSEYYKGEYFDAPVIVSGLDKLA